MRRRTYVVCSECGEMKEHRGRGLCNRCYLRVYRAGAITDHAAIRDVTDDSCFCECDEYDPEPIPFFNTSQCRRCKRPNREAVLASLSNTGDQGTKEPRST